MSRGVKWRLEWAFFLGENGRRQYNRLCKGCVHPCKQSFRAVVLDCPHFQSQRMKKGMDIVNSFFREKSDESIAVKLERLMKADVQKEATT